jgi:hypothetical protein
MAADFLDHVCSSIPEACNGLWSKTKGAYRFFDNESVTPSAILSGHKAAAAERAAGHRLILAVQDTTTLNFSSHPATQGLGLLGSHSDKTVGIFLHSTLALTPEGVALGIIDAQTWVRPPGSRGKAKNRAKTALEDKESAKWLKSFAAAVELGKAFPQTRVISVADREGDLYELFLKASAQPQVGALVRSKQSRRLENGQGFSWDKLAEAPAAGQFQLTVPRKAGRPERIAKMEIRHTEAVLRPPRLKPALGPIKVWLVEAREINSSDANPLLWRLVTTEPVENFEQALEKVEWYKKRWLIEEFHRVLKSGCKAEKRQLETAARAEKALILDMIVAWKVLEMSRAAREEPQAPAEKQLQADEVAVIKALSGKEQSEPLSLREAIRQIARLGGFLGRKGDGEPGVVTLWRGWKNLEQRVEGFRLGKLVGNA